MSSSMIEFVLLAAIALFIGWRLYVTLGEDSGPPAGRDRTPAPVGDPAADSPINESNNVQALKPTFTGPAAAGLEAIHDVDQTFDPTEFLKGAKRAYEMIVGAFAGGDRDTLRPLLDDDVYEAWDAALTERETRNEEGMQLLRLRKAEVAEASLDEEGIARVTIEFEAELGDGERTSRSDEFWTFKRSVRTDDPNWVLDDVDTA
ncbi:MAG: Tim44/TimA family putative adaptor protein [Pseudomonadota bacterium]